MGLPEGYTALEYIDIGKKPYIDTGVVPDLETEIEITFEYPDMTGLIPSSDDLLGARASWYTAAFSLEYDSFYGLLEIRYCSKRWQVSGVPLSGLHTLRMGRNRLTLDTKTLETEESAFSAGCSICLGGINTGGTVSAGTLGKLFSCRIYQGGVLIRSFLPCIDKNGLVCLYDEVSGMSYSNAGTGSITAGTVIEKLFPDNLIRYRTAEDVAERNIIGTYNADDLNRVADGARRVRELLEPLGYNMTPPIPERVWVTDEIPRESELAAHHKAVIAQDVLNYAKTKHLLPLSLSRMDHEGANNIERFIYETYHAALNIPEGYIFSGEIYGGEDL